MDDRTDLAIYRIEKEIRRNRDPLPCDDYERGGRFVSLCDNCGWDHEVDLNGDGLDHCRKCLDARFVDEDLKCRCDCHITDTEGE